MDQKLVLLGKVPLLAGLDRKDLEQVGRLCEEVDIVAGKVVARQGDPTQHDASRDLVAEHTGTPGEGVGDLVERGTRVAEALEAHDLGDLRVEHREVVAEADRVVRHPEDRALPGLGG